MSSLSRPQSIPPPETHIDAELDCNEELPPVPPQPFRDDEADAVSPLLRHYAPGWVSLSGRTIREELFRLSQQFFDSIKTLRLMSTVVQDKSIAPYLCIDLPLTPNIDSSCYPTHVFAVSPQPAAEGANTADAPVPIVAIHGIVLAAHCTKLNLPPPPHSTDRQILNLVTCRFDVASIRAWILLRSYMYGGSIKTFLSMLLPLPQVFVDDFSPNYASPGHERPKLSAVSGSEVLIRILARHVVDNTAGGYPKLLAHMEYVLEVWRMICDLGMYDTLLWMALRLAWQIARNALLIKRRA
ncbi:hypothetical protein R3P38DRAFT_2611806 [Favolaschia claudopus]|uniref:Uncharacterized protein n=1 Tax=Favolaschia claudopus TaxID=2862362 RepID=A0AAW0CTY9_9AGAR